MKSLVRIIGFISVLFIIQSIVVTSQSPAIPVHCGDIAQAEFTSPESFVTFSLNMSAGDSFSFQTERYGDYLRFNIVLNQSQGTAIFAPPGNAIETARGQLFKFSNSTLPDIEMSTGILGESGEYTIRLRNGESNGAFRLKIRCVLADGTVINPGDIPPDDASPTTPAPVFTGNGFPGVAPVDFSAGIELPLTKGQPTVGAVANDISLYTYNAVAGEVATLSISRASGDISIGVTVINKDTNEIIFLGGMPSSDKLSVELTFPAAGMYSIGLFRLDTAERAGTSGAVQITLE